MCWICSTAEIATLSVHQNPVTTVGCSHCHPSNQHTLGGDTFHDQTPPLSILGQRVVGSWHKEDGPSSTGSAAPGVVQVVWKGMRALGREINSWLSEGILGASGELTWMEQSVWVPELFRRIEIGWEVRFPKECKGREGGKRWRFADNSHYIMLNSGLSF